MQTLDFQDHNNSQNFTLFGTKLSPRFVIVRIPFASFATVSPSNSSKARFLAMIGDFFILSHKSAVLLELCTCCWSCFPSNLLQNYAINRQPEKCLPVNQEIGKFYYVCLLSVVMEMCIHETESMSVQPSVSFSRKSCTQCCHACFLLFWLKHTNNCSPKWLVSFHLSRLPSELFAGGVRGRVQQNVVED